MPSLVENQPTGNLNCEPQAIPLRSVRRLLRGRERVEVGVEIGNGYALLVRISKAELLRALRRAAKRGASTVPLADLMGTICVGA